MYVCIMNQTGEILVHRNMATTADELVNVIEPFRSDVVMAAECMFTWYWIADLCHQIGVKFVLGHALYMKAIHGGKVKNDKIDSQKIAAMLRGGMLPMAYVYPQGMRSTPDLLRRRMYMARQKAEFQTHIQNTNTQYNLPGFARRINYQSNRVELPEHFPDPMVRKSIEADIDNCLMPFTRFLSSLSSRWSSKHVFMIRFLSDICVPFQASERFFRW